MRQAYDYIAIENKQTCDDKNVPVTPKRTGQIF